MTHLLNIGPTDNSLYEGTAGIGLFLAEAAQRVGDARLRQLALDCFAPIGKRVSDPRLATFAPHLSLGYGSGVGGMLCALQETSIALGDDALWELALRIVDLPLEQALANDRQLDLMSGAAGAIYSLLSLAGDPRLDSARREAVLRLAERCGEQLLAKRIAYKSRHLWPCGYSDVPLTGFAHGAAGYACALLQLHGATGRGDFRAAALDAIGYERDTYVESARNWPDFRIHRDVEPGGTAFMAGWCAGAPGIGLARLLTLDVLDTPEVRQDVENAVAFSLELAKKPNPGESDHVCCGIAGRADFLLEAAGRLRRPEWEDAARASASFILRRFRSKDRYTFNGERSGPVFSPGLFTGLSGVGRLFLRVACRGNFS